MSNFLQGMPIPELGDQNFQTNFRDFCTAIKNNIERLISVQYARGNDGSSMVAEKITIDENLTSAGEISKLGAAILNTIFDTSVFQAGNLIGFVDDTLEIGDDALAPKIGDSHAIPGYFPNDTTVGLEVSLTIDRLTGKAYIVAPLVFIDGRINDLKSYMENSNNDYATFHDFSTVVFGEADGENCDPDHPENWNWQVWRSDIVPKLYFDETIHEFCWMVNGQETGVTAQGIKGSDGITPQVHIAKGTRNTDIINIEYLQYISDTQVVGWTGNKIAVDDGVEFRYGDDQTILVRPNDFILVFYNDATTQTNSYPYAFLGRPFIQNADVKILCDHTGADDIFDKINNQNFRNYLNSIFVHDQTVPDLRGLILPADEAPSSPYVARSFYHMLYSHPASDPCEDFSQAGKLHIAPVPEANTHVDVQDPSGGRQRIGDWLIDYNLDIAGDVKILGDAEVDGNLNVEQDVEVGGNLNVDGNITAHGLTATGRDFRPITDLLPAVVSKFTRTRCDFSKEMKTATRTVEGGVNERYNRITYVVKLFTNLNLKVGYLSGATNSNDDSANPNNLNIPHHMHRMMGYYGDANNMWAQGTDVQPKIADESGYATSAIRKNKPKLYDVIEYNIPITIATSSPGSSANNFILVKKDNKLIIAGSTGRLSQNLVNAQIREGGNSGTVGFTKSSWRCAVQGAQGVQYGGVQDWTYKDNDFFVQSGVTEDQGVTSQGSVYALMNKSKSQNQQSSLEQLYPIRGKLDYKNLQLEYYVGFDIRINEVIKRQAGNGSETDFNNNNISKINLSVIPVGFIQYAENGATYRAPIHAAMAFENELPLTTRNIIFGATTAEINVSLREFEAELITDAIDQNI